MFPRFNALGVVGIGLGVLFTVIGCESDKETGGGGGAAAGAPGVPPGTFKVTSSAFTDGQPIPVKHTCAGKPFPFSGDPPIPHTLPALNWTAGPAGTQSYAIVFKDVSLTTATPVNELGYHWAIWNIPASTLSLPEGLGSGNPIAGLTGAKQFSGPNFNDGFVGPCPSWAVAPGAPPPAAGAPAPTVSNDSYTFTVFALPTPTVTEPVRDTTKGAAVYVHALDDFFSASALAGGKAVLNGTSDAQPSEFKTRPPAFSVTSPAFADGQPIPLKHTCDGKPFPFSGTPPVPHTSPALNWTAGPAGTQSYAIVFQDVTLTSATPVNELGYHWAIWNIPAATLALPEGLASGNPIAGLAGAKQFSGPLFADGYVGPCPSWSVAPGAPPPEAGAPPPTVSNDSYTFTVYALPTATIADPAQPPADGPSYVHVLKDFFAANALANGTAVLNGTSNAQPSEFKTPPPAFALTSSAFTDGGAIPLKYTCDQKDFPYSGATPVPHTSPALTWTAGPAGTQSYAIVFKDTTLTTATPVNELGYHWAIWNIPGTTLSLPEGLPSGNPITGLAGAKQFSGPLFGDGYVGPCPSWSVAPGAPPPEEGAPAPTVSNDNYTFTVFALPTATITDPAQPPADGPSYVHMLDDFFTQNAIPNGTAVLKATSNAQPKKFATPPAAE